MKEKNPEFWTDANLIIFVVILEHLILLIKVMADVVIDDVPRSVKIKERKRSRIEKNATAYIAKLKNSDRVPFR